MAKSERYLKAERAVNEVLMSKTPETRARVKVEIRELRGGVVKIQGRTILKLTRGGSGEAQEGF